MINKIEVLPDNKEQVTIYKDINYTNLNDFLDDVESLGLFCSFDYNGNCCLKYKHHQFWIADKIINLLTNNTWQGLIVLRLCDYITQRR